MNSQNLEYLNKSDTNIFNENERMSTIKNDSFNSINQTDIEDVQNLNNDTDSDTEHFIPNETPLKENNQDNKSNSDMNSNPNENELKIEANNQNIDMNEIIDEEDIKTDEIDNSINSESDNSRDLSTKKVRFTDGEESNLSKIDEQTEESFDD